MSKLFLKEDYNTIKKRKVGPQKRLFKANVSDSVEKISKGRTDWSYQGRGREVQGGSSRSRSDNLGSRE